MSKEPLESQKNRLFLLSRANRTSYLKRARIPITTVRLDHKQADASQIDK